MELNGCCISRTNRRGLKEGVSSGMTLEKLIAMDPRAEGLIRRPRVLTRFERLRKR
jgi:hypothetical protein